MELDKAGNSNTAERLDLLKQFDEIFGFHRMKSLMADREFVGKKWFRALHKNKVPYFIRIKDNTLLPWGKEPLHVKKLFHHLQANQNRLVEKEMYDSTVYFAGTRAKAGDLVIIMTNQKWTAEKILTKYRERWSIEELFRKLKTSGFHWENTHMTKSPRLISLLIILGLGLLIAFLIGQNQPIPWKNTLGCPLYSIFKRGLIQFQFLLAHSFHKAIETIISLLESAKSLLFKK